MPQTPGTSRFPISSQRNIIVHLMALTKRRIDLLLVEIGLADTTHQAQALLMTGRVKVDGQRVEKAGVLVRVGATVEVDTLPQYVSRGGMKLSRAIKTFGINVKKLTAVDIGASTGGFTDCLLQQGAIRVYAIDVGYGQLDLRLRKDSRVVVMERLNARYPFRLPENVDLATVDVSFISLTKVLNSVTQHLKNGGHLITLVKPQFEARRDQVEKNGIVKNPQIHAEVLARLITWAIEQGFRLRDITPSPILGNAGNREFFLLLQPPGYIDQ